MSSDLVIIGAGPAGMAAAVAASDCGKRVTVIDDNPAAGGQIWRGIASESRDRQARSCFNRFANSGIRMITSAQVISADALSRTLLVETRDNGREFEFESLILATGARELFLPFPGWTLPGVMGVGGIQAVAKSGLPLAGRSVVLGGSGPLLLAVAAYLQRHGATIKVIAEQAPRRSLVRFAAALWQSPSKLFQAAGLQAALVSVPYRLGCWIEAAEGQGRVESVRLRQGNRVWSERCDFAGVAYGLEPNTELAALLGCEIERRGVRVDNMQRTSVDHIFSAGECTGIGGVDSALVQGRIAGYAAAGQFNRARNLFRKRKSVLRFGNSLNRAFALRTELKHLPQPDTTVCRCEDVKFGRLKELGSFRAAKLHTRCGMGPCQGRICGPATNFLFGWRMESIRPPIIPARISSLALKSKALEETAAK